MFINKLIEDDSKNSRKFFIIDSSSNGKYKDVDFEKYSWNTRQNNRIKEGDWFIYRRSARFSENREFYFFGAGQFGKISQDKFDSSLVNSEVNNPYVFSRRILKKDMDSMIWDFKLLKESWHNSFTTYGITNINKRDFLNIINLQVEFIGKEIPLKVNEEPLMVDLYKKRIIKDFSVDDDSTNSHNAARKLLSDEVKFNYGYKCAITGTSTEYLLKNSYIIPWSENKQNRLNPKNGICLSVLLHEAFSQGLITFENNGSMIISDIISDDKNLLNILHRYKNKKIPMNKAYSPEKKFLEFHRSHIFKS